MKIIFAGTPQFAADHLEALLDNAEHQIIAVFTQPDRRAGRGKKIQVSPVKRIAENFELNIYQPISLNNEHEKELISSLSPDIILTVAYGLLLPKNIISIPKYGAINVHASLLPKWRGAAPIERSIISGDKKTGITIMQMDQGLDTGEILMQKDCQISERETADSLKNKLSLIGKELLIKSLVEIENGLLESTKQVESNSTYAKKIDKSEGQINWNSQSDSIERKVRAFTSSIPSYTFINNKRIHIIKTKVSKKNIANEENICGLISEVNDDHIVVHCDNSLLEIIEVQLPGSNPMTIKALLNGRPSFFNRGQIFKDSLDNCGK